MDSYDITVSYLGHVFINFMYTEELLRNVYSAKKYNMKLDKPYIIDSFPHDTFTVGIFTKVVLRHDDLYYQEDKTISFRRLIEKCIDEFEGYDELFKKLNEISNDRDTLAHGRIMRIENGHIMHFEQSKSIDLKTMMEDYKYAHDEIQSLKEKNNLKYL